MNDSNGNVTTIGTGYSITGTTYNWSNLPTAITKSGTTYNYRYDHHAGGRTSTGLRVYKQEGDNIHTLRGAFGEVLATYKNGSHDYWNIVRPDGAVIGRREGSNRLYYHRDHLGSTRAVVNTSGSVVQTYDYYPFGLEMPGRSLTSGNYARERFTGHERDEEVGLDYMQARRYAAEFGRFLSVDPLADEFAGWAPYHYVHNNPLKYIDPTGMSACESESGQSMCVDNDDLNWALSLYEDKGLFGRIMNYLFTTDPEIGSKNFSSREFTEIAYEGIADDITKVANEAKEMGLDAAETSVGIGVLVADNVSLASDVALPAAFMFGPKAVATVSGIGFAADATSLTLKGVDLLMFNGSQEAFNAQFQKTAFNTFKGKGLEKIRRAQIK